MNINDLKTVEKLLEGVVCPEDLFGEESDAKKNFHRLVSMTYEDKYEAAQKPLAHALFIAVHKRWEEAERKMAHGTYGNKAKAAPEKPSTNAVSFKTGKYFYTVGRRIHTGGTCGIFEGEARGKSIAAPVIMRVPHSSEDNDLMEREVRAYGLMKKKAKEIGSDTEGEDAAKMFLSRFPIFLESVKLSEPGASEKKTVNTFLKVPEALTDWFTLEEIHKAYPKGVSTRVMTFIWNRILEGLTFAHASGVMHNALTPNHVLIHAESHYGNIIDWTASSIIGTNEKVPYLDECYAEYFPEEFLGKIGAPSPSSDIYMSAWCMVYLLGGDPKAKIIPGTVEEPIMKFLNRCLQPTRKGRPATAEISHKEFQQIAKDLFGPKKFVELIMPRAKV